MNIDAWIVMDKATLVTLWEQAHPTDETPIPDNVKLLSGGVRGFWKDVSGDEVVNVLDSVDNINAFQQAHIASVTIIYGWVQGTGHDNLDVYETIPAGVLALMMDHPGSIPATFENPNWGHVFLGQSERIFAGDFSNDFNGDFL